MRIIRRPAMAVWSKDHKWGTAPGDSTTYQVTRTDGGELEMRVGKDRLSIRSEMVEWMANAVAEAGAWSDSTADENAS